jgi:hypothetical protein
VTLLTGFDLCRAAMAAPGVSATERSVLMVLAIMANTEAKCWPPINDSDDGTAGLTTRCVLSERAVQRAVQQLVKLGHITRKQQRHGVIYTVHPALATTPVTQTGVEETGDTGTGVSEAPRPVPVAPKQPRTTIPKKTAPAALKPAKASTADTFLPANFKPEAKAGSITAKAMDAWPPGELEEQLEHFTDHHTAKRTKSADWQASWRTWVKNWKSFNGNRPRHDQRRSRAGNPRSHEMDDVFRDLGAG